MNYPNVTNELILKLTTDKASNIFEQKVGRLILPDIKNRISEPTVATVQKLTSGPMEQNGELRKRYECV